MYAHTVRDVVAKIFVFWGSKKPAWYYLLVANRVRRGLFFGSEDGGDMLL
jgi:hypothetical protein